MKHLIALCALILWACTASAQGADPIEDVIGSQLNAFNDREIDTAWGFASPNIQRLFGNSGNFGAMVQQGYPMVWDNAEVTYLDRREIAGQQVQKVLIRDARGGLHLLEYAMIETAQGWRINGVAILPAPDLGA